MAEKQRNEKKILFENAIAIGLTQIITYVIPLVSLPYLSRVLGVEKFGLVFWAQACIAYFILITEYGFNWSATKEISVSRDDKNKVSEIFSSVMGAKAALVSICFVMLTILVLLVPKFHNELKLFYLTFFTVIGNALYPIWYFQGIEHMKYVTFLKIISQSIFLILIFIFIKSPDDYLYVAVLNSTGYMIAGILSIIIACKRFSLKIRLPEINGIKRELKQSFEYFVANITNTIYTNTNSFILGIVASPVLVGYYVAAEKIYSAIHMLTSPIGTAVYPYIAKTKNIAVFKKIFYPTMIAMILISIFVYIFAAQIITIFYGKEMMEAYKVLRIFCITVLFSATSGLIGYPVLGALGHSKTVNTSIPIAAIVHGVMLIILYFTKHLSMWNIAYLTILPYAIMLSIRAYGICKYKLWNYKGEENV